MNGKLVVIDGADGSGKATQTQLLADRLLKEGRDVELMDFPRYTENTMGTLIRECLDGRRGDFMGTDPRIASVLYAADRYESRPQIEEWLAGGKVVVLDRYVSANMMHQGAKIAEDAEAHEFLSWLDHVEHTVFGLPRPDLIIYLDVPYEVRQELMEIDTARKSIDVAEVHHEHQKACEQRAKKIVAMENAWSTVSCVEGKDMRTRESIHEDIYGVVSEILKDS